jgi:hypothetical protein
MQPVAQEVHYDWIDQGADAPLSEAEPLVLGEILLDSLQENPQPFLESLRLYGIAVVVTDVKTDFIAQGQKFFALVRRENCSFV